MVAAGDDIDAIVEKFVGEARGDAKSGGRIFAVSDDEIDFFLSNDIGEPVADDLASWRADDVTDKENTHGGSLQLIEPGSKQSLRYVNRQSSCVIEHRNQVWCRLQIFAAELKEI